MNTKNLRFAVLMLMIVANIHFFERWSNANRRTERVLKLLEESNTQGDLAIEIANTWESMYRACAGTRAEPPSNVSLAAR